MKSEVYNCDNMELMAKYPDNHFELAIVDPPYGIDAAKMTMGKGSGNDKGAHKKKNWDNAIPAASYFKELCRVSKDQIIWGGNYFPLPPSRCWVLWDKKDYNSDFASHEMAWTSFDKVVKCFQRARSAGGDSTGKIHPTQKPVRLYEWLLANYAKEGDKILDTHLGSGSSRIACHNLKFNFVGCELDADYFKESEERYQEHIKQLTLF